MALVADIQYPYLNPAMRIITAITNANPAQVTTNFDHGYITGSIVRLYVPPLYGMIQANFLKGSITVNSSNTFLIDINTTSFDPFVVPSIPTPPTPAPTPPQCVPIGEDTDTLLSAFQNTLMPLF